MQIPNLEQAPFNTTLMGVLRGVADYYQVDVSHGALYGCSGHAFLINIHRELCPSGPYCWDGTAFRRVLRNLGIDMVDHGFFSSLSSEAERRPLEALLMKELDAGRPCALLNLENQLITGYDDTGFDTAQPWPANPDFPPGHLTFGTWEEFGEECHVNFYTFHKLEPADRTHAILDGLEYGVDLFGHPSDHTDEPYGVGPDAYDNFVAAVRDGHGASHGCWWNATVWAECRAMAASHFAEIGEEHGELATLAAELAGRYASISKGLTRVSDLKMAADEKIDALESLKAQEMSSIAQVGELATALRSTSASP